MKYLLKTGISLLGMAVVSMSAPAKADFWSDIGEKYKNVTLNGVTESTPPSYYVRDVLAPEFERRTGIKVQLETTSWDQMFDKSIKDMEAGTGIYDFVYIEQDIIYAYLARNFLVDTTKLLTDNPDIKAPHYDEAMFTSFADYFRGTDNHLFGVPMESFLKTYLYRSDLFSDPEIKAAFKEKTGRDLEPATTHVQYTEIAEFFTDYGKANNLELWGTTSQAHTGHPASLYEFLETVAPTFGIYNWGISAENNYAATVANGGSLNSDKAKAALKWMLHMRDLAPPESASSTWTEVASSFAAGRTAQGLIYGENAAWIASDPTQSKVVGSVGVALPPLAEGVLEDAEAGRGYVGYYDGGAFGIPVTSKNKEVAMLFIQFISEEEFQEDWAVAGSRITHHSTHDAPKVKELDKKLSGYFTLMREKGKLFAGAPEYPFHAQVREAMAPIFYDILTGNIDSDAGLDAMATKAEEELTDLGYRQ